MRPNLSAKTTWQPPSPCQFQVQTMKRMNLTAEEIQLIKFFSRVLTQTESALKKWRSKDTTSNKKARRAKRVDRLREATASNIRIPQPQQ